MINMRAKEIAKSFLELYHRKSKKDRGKMPVLQYVPVFDTLDKKVPYLYNQKHEDGVFEC